MKRIVLAALACSLAGCTFGNRSRPLYDGSSLRGWTTQGGHYDGDATWTIEDGAITGKQGPNGEGGLLYTEQSYQDFYFSCEFKIEEPMDSGVFLSMVPELRGYQVTIDTPQDGELGGIYSDEWLRHNPGGWTNFKRGAWNELDIFCRHDTQKETVTIVARLNREDLIRYQAPEDPKVFAVAGRIGLQVHGGQGMKPSTKVQFRNLRIWGVPLEGSAAGGV